ncbi:sensor histidine kinase [Streptosporangium sp. KLBMP 9127]|nr:HAMP domain-containing histidine kinase [Streptosporangium sp. KLBMP 9127]
MTLIASAAMALICLLCSVLVLIGLRDLVAQHRREQTVKATLRVTHLVQRDQLRPDLPVENVPYIQVLNPQGKIVAITPPMRGKPPMARFAGSEDRVRTDRVVCDSPAFPPGECLIIVGTRVYQPNGDYIVYAASPHVEWYVSPALILVLLGGSLLLVGVTAAGTYRTVSRTLAPVDAIRSELAEIKATDIGRRVPIPQYKDEIRRLAETVNQTLDRLQSLVERQRRFASDASHDLRSPLTAMRAQVEAALLHPRETNWPEVSVALLGSLERLEALVSDLLMLARLDAGAPALRERLDLTELIRSELDRRPRRVPITRRLTPGVKVTGDQLRLARLLTNLVDNAERHASRHVAVTVRPEAGMAVVEVVDDGTGIPPEKREEVFQRFTRLDAARSKDAGGTGLGLPIAREIAKEHGGTLTVEDSPHGAKLVARFPLAHCENIVPRHSATR